MEFVSKSTPIRKLADDDGYLILFRVIGGEYERGHRTGKWSIKEPGYSYSLNPYIANMWAYYPDKMPNHVIIARQKLRTDDLRYPSGKHDLRNGVYGELLRPETLVGDISYYDEVKVPFDQENPLLVIPVPSFKRVIDEFGGRPFSLDELIQKLSRDRSTRLIQE